MSALLQPAPVEPPSPSPPARRRGPWIAAVTGVVILGGAATAWAWQARADPVYDDERELAEYLTAVKDRRPRAGRLPPPAPSALLAAVPDLVLPVAAGVHAADRPWGATVLVTRTQILIGGDPLPVVVFPAGLDALAAAGLPARDKRGGPNDLYVTPLGNGLTWWNEVARARAKAMGEDYPSGRLAVLADATTPYRVLIEVLFTAGQAEFGQHDFGVRTPDGGLGWLTTKPPSINRIRRMDERSLELSAWVTSEGVALKTAGGNIAPGCQDVGSGIAIPNAGQDYDLKSLTACALRLKNANPAFKEETRVTIVASPSVHFGALVSVMEALRQDGDGSDLFPEVSFGVPRDTDGSLSVAPGRATPRQPRALFPSGEEPSAPSTPRAQGPIGNASIGGAAVSGGAVANASAVVAGMAAGFRRCYHKGLREDPKMKGSVRITAKIGPNGEVLSVSPSGVGLSGTVVSCVAARVSSAQFAAPEGGRATIVIPVTFVGQ